MPNLADSYINIARRLLPSPFTIAIILTALVLVLAMLFGTQEVTLQGSVDSWKNGLWNPSLLVFAIQMMLMLVLGYVLALSKPVNKLVAKVTGLCNTNARAVGLVCFFTLLVSFINWGLGLIFGAILTRKVGEYGKQNNISINYPLVGAAGYSGLMVWHGGLSGSAPIKVSEAGHFMENQIGQILLSETVFSNMNIVVSLLLLIVIPTFMIFLAKKTSRSELPEEITSESDVANKLTENLIGAEKIDHSKWFAYAFGSILLLVCLNDIYSSLVSGERILSFLNPNFINLSLLALAILFQGSINDFLKSLDKSIISASGILIQFPLYFGIMGIMNYSGLVNVCSDFFMSISNNFTYPIFTFISAGIVNVFVPSGGGQWAVQGPIIVEAAKQLGVDISKCIMALAYGDQLTNMLQPFWALPLLGITGLKAKDILPYSLAIMLVGGVIFIIGLVLF